MLSSNSMFTKYEKIKWDLNHMQICNQHCVSSTTPFIHDCVREHFNNENSSVKKRISICQKKKKKTRKVSKLKPFLWKILTHPQFLRRMQQIRRPFVLR